jgi:hypothetical protein
VGLIMDGFEWFLAVFAVICTAYFFWVIHLLVKMGKAYQKQQDKIKEEIKRREKDYLIKQDWVKVVKHFRRLDGE